MYDFEAMLICRYINFTFRLHPKNIAYLTHYLSTESTVKYDMRKRARISKNYQKHKIKMNYVSHALKQNFYFNYSFKITIRA